MRSVQLWFLKLSRPMSRSSDSVLSGWLFLDRYIMRVMHVKGLVFLVGS